VELGQAHGATRRLAVVSSTRGVFRWSCPDCRGAWSEAASTQAGSTTRSAPLSEVTQLSPVPAADRAD